ncbi:MAG: FlgK family flagellar hook-associated protein, partial [Shewanella sp.]
MATDLLGIGTSGVLAHQQLLRTTSNNIVNVNSEGFVRERTLVFTNTIGFGTGELKTERVISDYLQGEVRLDTSAFYAAKTHHEQLSQIDKLLADNGNSVGTALNNAFKAIHSANDAPADLGGRKIVMSELANTVDRF